MAQSDVDCSTGDMRVADLAQMAVLAGRLAAVLAPGDIVGLSGALGAGKTTFVRLVLQALGVAEEVPSPTFNLALTYATNVGDVWHFDLYRLEREEDAFELGIEEAFADAISFIEWPEQLGALLPAHCLEIHLEAADTGQQRMFRWTAGGHGAEKFATALQEPVS